MERIVCFDEISHGRRKQRWVPSQTEPGWEAAPWWDNGREYLFSSSCCDLIPSMVTCCKRSRSARGSVEGAQEFPLSSFTC